MRKQLLALVLVAACGGKQKHVDTVPLPPDPKVTEEEKKPAEEKPPAEAPKPPEPQPIDLPLASATPTVKLVNAGKGKKTALKLAPKAGLKQQLEIALDFVGSEQEQGKDKKEDTAPTVVLAGELETKEVAADGTSKFQLTLSGVDAKATPASKVPVDQFKEVVGKLNGATIGGTVSPNGSASDLNLHVDKADQTIIGALAYMKTAFMPIWPVLPAEPVGAGAKWTVTTTEKIADQVDVTKTVSYELVSVKGTTWTIKAAAKITGTDQELPKNPDAPTQSAKVSGITGSGTLEATLTDGVLAVPLKQSQQTEFSITVSDGAQTQGIKFHLEQTNAVTTK
jgi:hypothetical protein